MSWNYRVLVEDEKGRLGENAKEARIVECYYNDEGKMEHYCNEVSLKAKTFHAKDALNSIRMQFDRMQEAFAKPPIKLVDGKIVEVEL